MGVTFHKPENHTDFLSIHNFTITQSFDYSSLRVLCGLIVFEAESEKRFPDSRRPQVIGFFQGSTYNLLINWIMLDNCPPFINVK